MVLAELGRFPLQVHFWQQILRYGQAGHAPGRDRRRARAHVCQGRLPGPAPADRPGATAPQQPPRAQRRARERQEGRGEEGSRER